MERRNFGVGDTGLRFHPRRPETTWLYNPITEEFRRDPGSPRGGWEDLDGELSNPRVDGRVPGRARRLGRFLFANGAMSVVLLFGLILFALISFALGFR